MRIELNKQIKLKSIEIIAEVDFYQESPYIKLLEEYSHVEDLKIDLKGKMEPAAIKNIIKNLEALKIINNGSIVDLENGFPEREYGKYQVNYYENDTTLPFQYKKHNIRRLKATDRYTIDNIKDIQVDLRNILLEKGRDLKRNEDFQILEITKNQGLYLTQNQSSNLSLLYENNNWHYFFIKSGQKFEMIEINLDEIFKGTWNIEENAIEKDFDEIEDNKNAIKNFKIDYDESIELVSYGKLEGKFNDIPIIPNENSYMKWFLYLLKDEIESLNRYITFDELEQIWENIYYKTPQINKRFEIPFDFKSISSEYSKDSEFYWQLMAGKDLNPFIKKEKIDEEENQRIVIIIEEEKDVELKRIFDSKLGFNNVNTLIIIDRYINTLYHFKSLKALLQDYDIKKNIILFSTKDYKTSQNEQKYIKEICDQFHIKRAVMEKNDIPHDRYWRLDDLFFSVTKSIDFIQVEKDTVNIRKHTIFAKIDKENVEPQALNLLGEINE